MERPERGQRPEDEQIERVAGDFGLGVGHAVVTC
jgi:hypothetical protein